MKDGKAGVAMGEGESFFPSPIHPSFTVSERDLIQDKGLPTGSKLREKGMETEDDMMTPEDQAYWDGMPEETPGVPSPADNLAQALLEARVNIIMEIKGRRFDEDFEDGILAGQLDATVRSLTLAVEHLELSPRQRYVVTHALKRGTQPEY